MGTVTIQDPIVYEPKNVDSNGKVHFGKDWAGKKVRILIEDVEDE